MWRVSLFLSFILAAGALAQPVVPPSVNGVLVATEAGCRSWVPTKLSPPQVSMASWSGACVAGLAEGKGALVVEFADKRGLRFDGTMRRGLAFGYGVLDQPDRTLYEGYFDGGLFEGHGRLTLLSGGTLEAGFRAGAVFGAAIWTLPDGTRIEGTFDDSLASGRVLISYQNGEKYGGDLRAGRREGEGFMRFADGSRYDGAWRDNLPDGQGVLTVGEEHFAGSWRSGCLKVGERWVSRLVRPSSCG